MGRRYAEDEKEMREANPFQNTGTWFNDRTGKLTASRMAAAMSFKKDGSESAERRKLKVEILAERLTGNIVPKYVTAEMQWGIDQEPVAKEYFTAKTGWKVIDLGFVDHHSIDNCGASPDGLVEDQHALIEIKCPTTGTMLGWWLKAAESPTWVPEEHIPQMTLQSACLGGIPVWFCGFDPRLPEKQKVLIRKFEPTKTQIEEVEKAAETFLAEIEAMFYQINTME